jgi:hypothetical protein
MARLLRRTLAVSLVTSGLVLGVTATAASASPITGLDLIMGFGSNSVQVGQITSLAFTIANETGEGLTGVGFADTLPSGLEEAGGVQNLGCGGSVALVGGPGGKITLSGVSMSDGGGCTITLFVEGTSAGNQDNSVTLTSNQGTGETQSASILVTPAPPSIGTSFGALSIAFGGTTTLSFSISNPNSVATLTGVGFTDDLPSGLVVANPNMLSGSCGGGTITADEGSSTVSLSGATLAGGASCSFSLDVSATSVGIEDNSVTVTSDQGDGNTASSSITVSQGSQTITFSPSPPTSALFGSSLTLDATGGGSGNPVTFSLDSSSTLGACSLSGANDSVVTFTGAGDCVIDANQAGNTDYLAAPTVTSTIEVTYSAPCLSMSGYHGLIVRSGEAMCLSSSAVVIGPITVESGGSLDIEGASVSGSVTTNGAGVVKICDSNINGHVSVNSTSGLVLIGGLEGSNCAGNTVRGPVSVTNNTAGIEFDYNTVDGPLTITGNTSSIGLFGDTVTGTETIQ